MPTPTTVEVNGFALREIRVRSGIGVMALAGQVGVQRPYIAKIELGHSQRVSPKVFTGLLQALEITDRRALLADQRVGTQTAIEINGFALREIRERSGIAVLDLARQVDVQRPYIAKIELGHSQRVSPKVFDALLGALAIQDRRVLLANPHVTDLAEAAGQ